MIKIETPTIIPAESDPLSLHLDCSNDPLTGNLELTKADPTITITDSGDSASSLWTRADTNTQMDIKNAVYQEASTVSKYPAAFNTTYCKATSVYYGAFQADDSFDWAEPLTGAATGNQWIGNAGTNQRLQVDLTDAYVIGRIYYENGHDSGNLTDYSAKNFKFWGSNTATFTDVAWKSDADMITAGWTLLPAVDAITGLSQFTRHTGSDVADPQYITVTNAVAYKYYCMAIADAWAGSHMGIRRVEMQVSQVAGPVSVNVLRSSKTGSATSLGQVILGDASSLIRLNQADRTFLVKYLKSEDADGATALGFDLSTTTSWVNASATLFKVNNSTVNKLQLLANGSFGINGGSVGTAVTVGIKNVTNCDTGILGAEQLTASGWTSTGWTGDWAAGFTHTAGNTNVLSNNIALSANERYVMVCTVSGGSAGSFTITLGTKTSASQTATCGFGCIPLGSANVQITPTTDFNRKIVISLKKVTGGGSALTLTDSTGTYNTTFRQPSNTNSFYVGAAAGAYSAPLYSANNFAFGPNCLGFLLTGSNNIAFGINVLNNLEYATNCTGIGDRALESLTGGGYNLAIGSYALNQSRGGTYNMAIGYYALGSGQDAADTNKLALGNYAGKYSYTESNVFYLNMLDRTNTAGDKSGSIFYGVFNATAASQTLQINASVGILLAPTARLTLPAGTATAGTAPMKFTDGALTTIAVAAQMEYLITSTVGDLYFTPESTNRNKIVMTSGVTSLTTGRVPFATTNGRLTDDADMTFSGSRLTVTDLTSTNAPIVSSLTAGRVVFAGASKELVDDADMTFSGDTLTVTKLVIATSLTTVGGTAPVADGTYTVGARLTPVTGIDGTITVKSGIITAIQPAT